jgi:hypothetical protein
MRPYQLSEDEVANRVEQYSSPDITEVLYRFGTIMIQENLDRTKQLETKTTAVAGFSVAVLSLLISRSPAWLTIPMGWQGIAVVSTGMFASLAIVLSLYALLVRTHRWFSDSQWFENENDLLDDKDRLTRYYVLAMHGINQQMDRSNTQKANRIFAAQIFLALAGLSMAALLSVPVLVSWASSMLTTPLMNRLILPS